MPDPPEHKLRWYQYSLRSLFILTTLVAIACSWYANEMQKAAKRRAAIAAIEKVGAHVYYYDASNPKTRGEPPGWFSWLRKLHGDEHLGNAVRVFLLSRRTTDDILAHLKGLTKLETLHFNRAQVTDAGLVHLKGLMKLEYLNLYSTQITDEGLAHLKGLTKLEQLVLSRTRITDAGLVHLEGLTNLQQLCIIGTSGSGEGLKKFQEALPNCKIMLFYPQAGGVRPIKQPNTRRGVNRSPQ